MNKKQRVEKIENILDELFPAPPIPLDHVDPFSLLVATVLSAQCTDVRVNLVTPHLFDAYADVHALAAADVEAVREIIRPCGLSPSKSKALVGLSNIIVSEHGGTVPESFEALEKMPGVGHKTASVVLAQGFGVPAFPVDTHIHRLAKRWKLSNGKSVEQTEKDLKRLFKKEEWNKRHLQIIYFGRAYCPARGHVVEACPICRWI
ncbi:MAG: endonuclease III [Deltaproteobacteria bacterium]|nr:endonuclease III [Deltaproteobacteria bacterium]MBN2673792.1 endonuclease III [Deltaproteobacteria bacterium]